jgi:hypothetical protein
MKQVHERASARNGNSSDRQESACPCPLCEGHGLEQDGLEPDFHIATPPWATRHRRWRVEQDGRLIGAIFQRQFSIVDPPTPFEAFDTAGRLCVVSNVRAEAALALRLRR